MRQIIFGICIHSLHASYLVIGVYITRTNHINIWWVIFISCIYNHTIFAGWCGRLLMEGRHLGATIRPIFPFLYFPECMLWGSGLLLHILPLSMWTLLVAPPLYLIEAGCCHMAGCMPSSGACALRWHDWLDWFCSGLCVLRRWGHIKVGG